MKTKVIGNTDATIEVLRSKLLTLYEKHRTAMQTIQDSFVQDAIYKVEYQPNYCEQVKALSALYSSLFACILPDQKGEARKAIAGLIHHNAALRDILATSVYKRALQVSFDMPDMADLVRDSIQTYGTFDHLKEPKIDF